MSDENKIDPAAAELLGIADPANPPLPSAPARPDRFAERGIVKNPGNGQFAAAKPKNGDPEAKSSGDPGPTRGRPADGGVYLNAEEGYVDDGLQRRPLDEADGNSFEIPAALTRRGWAYQWVTTSVLGQPTDPADMGFSQRQGWQPCVDPEIRKHFMPPTWEKKTIEQRGQMLMTRPERLQREAFAEQQARADEQKLQKLRSALAAPDDQHRFMPRKVEAFVMEGELGAYGDDPVKRERRA